MQMAAENADDTKQIVDDKKQIEDDAKQIKDDTKQKCGMKTYGICGSPGSQFCKSGIGILQKGEVIP
ncbi:hypothetical protein T4E_4380 [Trichinella pseudospiralis]|uniref:Uncharacterized protein n=1 Tax=Trichinella pseudospiralis TaxID=6337 RepID=A0A0V0Y254_TRIPS|nr:hypothetical protein T4E_4380 [Trichinella pseudospiralis]